MSLPQDVFSLFGTRFGILSVPILSLLNFESCGVLVCWLVVIMVSCWFLVFKLVLFYILVVYILVFCVFLMLSALKIVSCFVPVSYTHLKITELIEFSSSTAACQSKDLLKFFVLSI